MKILCTLLALAATSFLAPEDEKTKEDPTLELGRVHCTHYLHNGLTALWENFTPEMKDVFGGRAVIAAQRRKILGDWGTEAEMLTETVGEKDGFRTYSRVSRFERCSPLIEMYWMFDDEDRIASYRIQRKYINAPSEHLEHVTTTDLRLPMRGEWRVLAAGRDVATNHHAASFDQRFGLDLWFIEDEEAFEEEGRHNEEYFGWGRQVLSPAAGVVHATVDDVVDNPVKAPDFRQPLGNHVIVDHENGEFSFLAHLKQGSVTVKKGDRVKTGELLGLVGNSGDSKIPHIHHHLQLTGEFLTGDGLPAQFQDYVADDETVARGEPVQRQSVRNMTEAEREAAQAAIGPRARPRDPDQEPPETPEKKD